MLSVAPLRLQENIHSRSPLPGYSELLSSFRIPVAKLSSCVAGPVEFAARFSRLRGSRIMILSIEDLRNIARRRVPRAIFDYADGGSYAERTLRANAAALGAISFRPRVMVDVREVNLDTTFVGCAASMPLAIGPTGLAGLFHADGEILGARAAAAFGIPFCLSTMSICSIEDVRAASDQPFWLQQYLMRDRGL